MTDTKNVDRSSVKRKTKDETNGVTARQGGRNTDRARQLVELVQRISEQKRRALSAQDAVQKARKELSDRGKFVPKQGAPPNPIVTSF